MPGPAFSSMPTTTVTVPSTMKIHCQPRMFARPSMSRSPAAIGPPRTCGTLAFSVAGLAALQTGGPAVRKTSQTPTRA